MIYRVKNKLRSFSHYNKIGKKIYLVSNKLKVQLLSWMSDERFATMKYKENTGKKLNLKKPKTYNEKLWWLKINNRDPLLTVCSDKYKVRDYVKECGLSHILTETYGAYDSADDIKFENLPNKVFIKCNHGSGTNIIYDKSKDFDKDKFKKRFNKALKQNYYLQSREWNYKDIQPKLLIEEMLEDDKNHSLIDYRFLCFNGKVKMIFIDIDTADSEGSHNPDAKRNVYDTEFKIMNIKVGRENFDPRLVEKPNKFEEMIKYAEILSKPFPHCRVDLYNVDEKVYFGEITFYPGGATQKITPEEWDIKLGSWINLDNEKTCIKNNV